MTIELDMYKQITRRLKNHMALVTACDSPNNDPTGTIKKTISAKILYPLARATDVQRLAKK